MRLVPVIIRNIAERADDTEVHDANETTKYTRAQDMLAAGLIKVRALGQSTALVGMALGRLEIRFCESALGTEERERADGCGTE